jgi:hypothetical protein
MALSPKPEGPKLMTLTTTGLRAAADRLIAAAAAPLQCDPYVTSWARPTSRPPTRCNA